MRLLSRRCEWRDLSNREFSESSFDGIGLRVTVPLGDGDGTVPCDAGQREGIAAALSEHG